MTAIDEFDLNASFPADLKHQDTVEALVAQAAQCAGCSPDVAKGFADEVGVAFGAGVSAGSPNATVGVRLERSPDSLEVVVSCGKTVRMSRPLHVTP